jgi:hypothetical protein
MYKWCVSQKQTGPFCDKMDMYYKYHTQAASISVNNPANPSVKQIVQTVQAKSVDTKNQEALRDKMANDSISNAFALAARNCRDCTEILCRLQK